MSSFSAIAPPPTTTTTSLLPFSTSFTLLLLNLPKQPKGSELPPCKLTIDGSKPIIPSPKFTGIANWAEGIHFVTAKFFLATKESDNGGGSGVSHGFFVNVPPPGGGDDKTFVIRSYDRTTEEISPSTTGNMTGDLGQKMVDTLNHLNSGGKSRSGDNVDGALEVRMASHLSLCLGPCSYN